ncbi:sigma-70 family RNA polymerase sigma factor [Salinispora vitiensis]|uniref:sigma-70 family RNA polymerase sigma factor n=1 Tax=Salinispora vitiensis TaxID=999544 RepID=UPI00036C086F|nr:sigma-70 family RNA polymerase sigma factor [Salinispora vitiensis]
MDELRAIIDNRDVHQAQSAIAEFVARHRLTRSDIDALVVALAQPQASSDRTRPPDATPTPQAQVAPTATTTSATETTSTATTTTATETATEPAVSGAEATLDDDLPDSDVGWMFDDDPVPPDPLPADDAVGRAFEDLFGDWIRTGGRLTRADVALLATRRSLTAAQTGELLGLLADAGVDLPALASTGPVRSGRPGNEPPDDTVRQYLREIGRYPLLDAAREVELWSLMKQGATARAALDANGSDLSATDRRSLHNRAIEGQHAHTALVCANLRLVVSIAKARQYRQTGVAFADRIQDGNTGLIHAAHLFDGSKGYKFSTYATWWIKQSIERGIGNHGRIIRVPLHVHERIQKIRRATRKLTDRLGREPTLDELADTTSMEPGKVQAMLELAQPALSIDLLLSVDGDLRLSDVLGHDEERDGRTDPAAIVEHATLRGEVDRLLRTVLPDRAVDVIRRRFGLSTGAEETLDDIAADHGVSRERIRQIQGKAMSKLQRSTEKLALRPYLGSEPGRGASTERKTR